MQPLMPMTWEAITTFALRMAIRQSTLRHHDALKRAITQIESGNRPFRHGDVWCVQSRTTTGTTYRMAGDECVCKAAEHQFVCWHMAAVTLYRSYLEAETLRLSYRHRDGHALAFTFDDHNDEPVLQDIETRRNYRVRVLLRNPNAYSELTEVVPRSAIVPVAA